MAEVKKCDTFECPNNTKWEPNPAAVVGGAGASFLGEGDLGVSLISSPKIESATASLLGQKNDCGMVPQGGGVCLNGGGTY